MKHLWCLVLCAKVQGSVGWDAKRKGQTMKLEGRLVSLRERTACGGMGTVQASFLPGDVFPLGGVFKSSLGWASWRTEPWRVFSSPKQGLGPLRALVIELEALARPGARDRVGALGMRNGAWHL